MGLSGKNRAQKIREFILGSVGEHPVDLVDTVEKEFSVTRTTVHRHIDRLLSMGQLIKTGSKKGTRYYLPEALSKKLVFKNSRQLEEHKIWESSLAHSFRDLSMNVGDICYYGFSEIFNNAIDHSEGSSIHVETRVDDKKVRIEITDNGVGVFRKIQAHLDLSDVKESILHLTKGKLTTAPEHHSGEGIFFSSRAFDTFEIKSSGFSYVRDNLQKDWFLLNDDSLRKVKGTTVIMEIGVQSQTHLREVFEDYQDPETYAFNQTHIVVQFSQLGDERFVSRSQAKRVLRGVEGFEKIVLDFKGVRTVGQAFVDEVFRVFKQMNPHVSVEFTNANEEIEFMIKRGISTPR